MRPSGIGNACHSAGQPSMKQGRSSPSSASARSATRRACSRTVVRFAPDAIGSMSASNPAAAAYGTSEDQRASR